MLAAGTVLQGYRIDGVIGEGGMGVVYSATQISLDRTVALKVLTDSLSRDDSFRERFRREGMLQAAIDHPHIVPVYEAGESEYGLFLAMRLVRGSNLKDLIEARELDAHRTILLLGQVAGALDTAHAAGLVHRDIKPQNILVDSSDRAYLADFGLTKAAGTPGLTRTGQFLGSLDYVSPEQIRGQTLTARGDTYSLAAVLYECLTGLVPYPKESDAAVIYAHMTDPPPLITEQRPELPAALDAVIARAMSKNPEERHASATEFIEDAGRVLESRLHGLEAPDPVEPPTETEVRPPAAPTVTGPAEEAETLEEDAVPADEPVADTPTEPTVAAEPPVEESEPPEPVTTGAPQPAPATVAAKGAAPTEIAKAALTAPAVAAPTSAAAAPAAVEVKPEKDEAAPKDRRRLRWAALAAGGLIVLAGLGAAGYAVADSRGEEATTTTLATEAAAEPVSASSAGLGLTHLDTWREAESDPEIPGIPATDGLALEPADSNGESGLVATRLDSLGPALLPAELLAQLDEPPDGEAVRLGDLQAYRYTGLEPEGFDGAVTVYAAPTSEGVATLACWSRSSLDEVAPECDRIAASLELQSGEPYAIGPSRGFARTVNRAFRPLDRARASGVKQLANAGTPAQQARAAGAIAAAFASAAAKIAGAQVSPEAEPARDSLVASLRQTATAYRDLAAAARKNQEGGYNQARNQIGRREAGVERALAGLEQLGYGTS